MIPPNNKLFGVFCIQKKPLQRKSRDCIRRNVRFCLSLFDATSVTSSSTLIPTAMYASRSMQWRSRSTGTILRLNAMFNIAVKDDGKAVNPFADLITPLLAVSSRPWSKAETTFAIFEKCCSLFPDYKRACESGMIHVWFCDIHTIDDAPFVALYQPYMFLEEKK